MTSDAMLISDIMALPPAKKAEIAEYVEKLKKEIGHPIKKKPRRPPADSMPNLFKVGPDFDEPLEEDFENYTTQKPLIGQVVGSRPGAYIMAPNFDDPLEEFEEYM